MVSLMFIFRNKKDYCVEAIVKQQFQQSNADRINITNEPV